MNYINKLNQMLVPGDRVLSVTTGYSNRVKVREAVYTGVSPSGAPQVTWKRTSTRWRKADGTLSSWKPGSTPERYTADFTSTVFSGRVYKLA